MIKRTILNGISLIDQSVLDIMWFKLDSKVVGFKKDLCICFLYISPANYSYTVRTGVDQQIFSKVEDDVTKYNDNGDILIMGDLNAHINCNERDFIQNDLDDVLDSFFCQLIILQTMFICCVILRFIKIQMAMENVYLNYVMIVNFGY